MMSLGPSGLGSSGLGPWIEASRTGRASSRWMRAGWLKGGAKRWAWCESEPAVPLGLRQGNPAERLPPEAPINIEVTVQREDLGNIQAL